MTKRAKWFEVFMHVSFLYAYKNGGRKETVLSEIDYSLPKEQIDEMIELLDVTKAQLLEIKAEDI